MYKIYLSMSEGVGKIFVRISGRGTRYKRNYDDLISKLRYSLYTYKFTALNERDVSSYILVSFIVC